MNKFLYDSLAERWYHGGSIFLYSDPHFDDEESNFLRTNYIGDDEQVKSINKKLGKNDTIIFLGDIGNVEFIKRIRGYKILIMGNHDKGATNYKRVRTGIDNCLFDEVYEGPLFINDRLILSHEPIDVPEYFFNIHGHIHTGPATEDQPRHLNVCAEHINYTPISLVQLLKKGLLKDIETIHRKTIDRATTKKRAKQTNCDNIC